MSNRIPTYFQLQRYNITPEDIVRNVLCCDADAIQSKVIVMPNWRADIFSSHADVITAVSEGVVYQLEYHGQRISVIRSGIGAPQTGDVILTLGCTPCDRVVFAGSVGGLDSSMKIGDLIVTEKSICGDGFSRYLDADVQTKDCFLQPIEPDSDLTECVKNFAFELCQRESVPIHCGTIFSIDTIIAQFFRLDYFVKNFHCIGIEMETSAVFRAAKLVGIKASALLQVSDVIPMNKTVYSGRTNKDMGRRKFVKERILPKVILDSLLISEAQADC